jgi:hypothetical protein
MTAAEVDGGKEVSHEDVHNKKLTLLTLFKYVASVGILIFSIIIVATLVFIRNVCVSSATNPWVCLVVCVSMLQLGGLFLNVGMRQFHSDAEF